MGELRDIGDQDEGPPAAPCAVHPHLLWDCGVLLAEASAPSGETPVDALQTPYLHEPGSFRPLAIARRERPDVPAVLHHYQLDRLGTPQELVNDNGLVTWRAELSVWGALARTAEADIANPLRFQGQYEDVETGLLYNRHRYYDPIVARYTSPDPIGLEGGMNGHAYVSDPLSLIDPLGLYKGEGTRDLGKYHVFHEHTLSSSEYQMTDAEHFRRANESVYHRLQTDPEFRRTMQTKYPEVVDHVQPTRTGRFRGTSPGGTTWHHGNTPGSLQLVDHADHQSYHKIYHPDGTGGRNKWGGGTSCRA